MPEMQRRFFLGFGFAALPLAVFGQSSQTEAPASGVPRLLHFDEVPSLIRAYRISADGKKIAIARAKFNDTDVVMFSNFR